LPDQVVDGGRMDIDARDRTAPEGCGHRPGLGRAARHALAFASRCKPFRRQSAVFGIENAAEDDDFAVEPALEIFLVAAGGAEAQVGKREGWDVAGAAFEIEGHGIRHFARNTVAGEGRRAVRRQFRRGLERPGRQFERHPRQRRAAAGGECEQYPANGIVAVDVDVERPDVLLLANRNALPL
jgi:hypothetical protein